MGNLAREGSFGLFIAGMPVSLCDGSAWPLLRSVDWRASQFNPDVFQVFDFLVMLIELDQDFGIDASWKEF